MMGGAKLCTGGQLVRDVSSSSMLYINQARCRADQKGSKLVY